MEIEWKDVVGYEGYYQVSNAGEVRSMDRSIVKSNGVVQNRSGRILPQRLKDDGYLTVRLSRESVRREYSVHSLVAHAFVDGYFSGAEVNHKDFDRTNNCFLNLEWITHADNIAYTIREGRHVSQLYDFAGDKNPNYGNRTLSTRYANNPELAIEKQSRKGAKNGRAIPVRMFTATGDTYDFEYLSECGEYLISSGISNSKTHILSHHIYQNRLLVEVRIVVADLS